MYLHFIMDSVFSQRFIEMNDKISKDNVYILLGNEKNIKYLSKEKVKIINIPNGGNRFIFLLKYLKVFFLCKKMIKNADRIYFHFLHFFHCLLLFSTLKKLCSYWLVWGADVYNRIDYELYDNKTKKVIPIPYKKKNFKYIIRKYIEHIAIKKISFVGTIIKGDYKLISENFEINNNRIDFYYPNPLKIDNYSRNVYESKYKRILIGNSGDPANNHISVIEALKKMNNIEVICPLSYGDKQYINIVIDYGRKIFGDRFIPIINFLKQEEYLKLLDSVDIAIFNNFRQQAMANIFALIMLGKKVYINKRSPVFDFCIDNGIVIENTEVIIKEQKMNFLEYSKEIIENNKKIILNLNSEKKSIEYLRNLYSE